jgi:hypothetical protein
MANENPTPAVNHGFWDNVEASGSGGPVVTSAPDSTTSTVSHGFWDRVEGKQPATGGNVVNIGGQPVDLKTGVGGQQAAVSQADQANTSQVKDPQGHITSDPAHVSPITRGGYGMPGNVLPDIGTPERAAGTKMATTMAGAMAAPALVPEIGGSGLLSYLGRLLTRSVASGVGAGAGNSTGQAITGENPLAPGSLKESGKIAAMQTAISIPFEAVADLPATKLGRSAINQSLGTQTRDITYGSPAKAIVDEGIGDVVTGDFEAYKKALQAGKTPAEASQAAGGRFAAVSQRVQEYAPRLEKALAASKATISTADAIDAPLHQAAFDIINNPAMTDAEKDAAINQLGALQKSLKQGLGDKISPLQLNKLKQAIGNRVNWGGNVSVTDEVKPAYRSLYSTMKNLISKSVPEAKELNERLSNLLAAQSDLETLMKAEEVGRGGGVAGGKIGSTVVGMAEREAGRVLPGAAKVAQSPAVKGATAGAASGVVDGNDEPQVQVPIAQNQNTDDWLRFRASDGKAYLADPQHWPEVQRRDPGAQQV